MHAKSKVDRQKRTYEVEYLEIRENIESKNYNVISKNRNKPNS